MDIIAGLSWCCIEIPFAEVDRDMSAFPDAAHYPSQVGICPDNCESGGKRLNDRNRKCNHWVKANLAQVAQPSPLRERKRDVSERPGIHLYAERRLSKQLERLG